MSNQSDAKHALDQGLVLLKGMGAQSPSSRLGVIGERAAELFALLDGVLAGLSGDISDDLLEEVERVVETLHDVDQSWPACGDEAAGRKLDIAASRLRRIEKRLS